jgi:hypothetical protein
MTKLTAADLAAETVELLPDRDTLVSLTFTKIDWAAVSATNVSNAVNLFTSHSQANSAALQAIDVRQY